MAQGNTTSTSLRLRQAILSNDIALVERLLKADPHLLHNPNFKDKSNTNLHLAAQAGHVELAEFLISLGHDRTPEVIDYIYSNAGNNQGISVNTDGFVPLHFAASLHHVDMIELLCTQFPQTIERRDKQGRTPLLLAAGVQINSKVSPPPRNAALVGRRNTLQSAEDVRATETLLRHGADIRAIDSMGSNCLHFACAFGNLKTIRALIQAGADPLQTNNAGWRADSYSLTVQSDVYFRTLVAEFEKRKAEAAAKERNERRPPNGGGGGVRLVENRDDEDSDSDTTEDADEEGRKRADSGRSNTTSSSGEGPSGLGINVDMRGAVWR